MCECFTQLIILRTSSRAGTDSASWLKSCEKQRRANTGVIFLESNKYKLYVGLKSLKSRGPATGWVQIPVQGRLSTSAGQARPRIICGPASHLPTSYLRPAATILGLHGCSGRSSESRVCHHCRAGGPVTPTLTTVPCPPGWSGSTWLHLGPPGHLCCSSSDNLPSSCNPTIQLFHALPTLITFSSNN